MTAANKMGFRRGSVALAAAIGLGLGASPAAAESCPTQCASGKVPLGIAAPTSGQAAAFGRQALKPAEIAVRELNAAGGLMGTPVELIVGDDRCDPGLAPSVAKHHVESDKIQAVIGPVCPAAATAAAPIYSEAGVIQFLPTVPMLELGRQTLDKLFRMVATDEQEALALDAYLAREQKGKKLTVVYTDAFYRRAIIDTIQSALPADMKESARFEPLLDNSGAYDRLADNLQRNRPDVIYLALDNAMVLELVAKLRKRGVKSLLIGGQRLLSREFWLTARDAAEGIHVLAPVESLNSPEFRKTVDLLRQADVVPDLVALNSYAAIETWAQAVQRAGGGDPAKVADALRSGEFKTAVGPVAFDQQGARRDIRYSVLSWQGGRLRPGVEAPR